LNPPLKCLDLRYNEKMRKKQRKAAALKGFVWDPFVISIMVFFLFIALPITTQIGNYTTQEVISSNPTLNASQQAVIQKIGTNIFDSSPDVILIFLYFVLILVAFISAGYEGANPAVTLILGLFFVVLAEIISFNLSDIAHSYITQTVYLNIAKHYSLTTYLMDYLPYFNGVLTIAYILFVIMRREVIMEAMPMGRGGGVVST